MARAINPTQGCLALRRKAINGLGSDSLKQAMRVHLHKHASHGCLTGWNRRMGGKDGTKILLRSRLKVWELPAWCLLDPRKASSHLLIR